MHSRKKVLHWIKEVTITGDQIWPMKVNKKTEEREGLLTDCLLLMAIWEPAFMPV
jgi:hypothetical protein